MHVAMSLVIRIELSVAGDRITEEDRCQPRMAELGGEDEDTACDVPREVRCWNSASRTEAARGHPLLSRPRHRPAPHLWAWGHGGRSRAGLAGLGRRYPGQSGIADEARPALGRALSPGHL